MGDETETVLSGIADKSLPTLANGVILGSESGGTQKQISLIVTQAGDGCWRGPASVNPSWLFRCLVTDYFIKPIHGNKPKNVVKPIILIQYSNYVGNFIFLQMTLRRTRGHRRRTKASQVVPNRSTCINFAFIIDFYSF
jgi:hypothetical protein